MNKAAYALKLVWLNAGFYGCLVFMTAFSIVFLSVPIFSWFRFGRGFDKGKAMRHLIWWYGRAWARLLAFFVPLQLENVDRPLPKPCIIAPNHQSFFDTYCFGFMSEPDVVFAVRAWPFRIPFYAPYMRTAEYLNTEGMSSEELLKKSKAVLDKGACIGVFPEGTRSRDGRMQRFHSGAFYLAVFTDTPVVPVCLDGTGIFLQRGGLLLRPAKIAVKVLDPVYPRDFAHLEREAPRELRLAVKSNIQKALDELRSEPSGSAPHP